MGFDFIATGKPVDATAAMVLRPGEHYEPRGANDPAHHSETPIPTVRYTGPKEHDITGMRNGSLVVVGFAHPGARNGALWVVRCDCGHYERRTAKSMKNPKNWFDACRVCRDLQHLRRKAQWIAAGRPDGQGESA